MGKRRNLAISRQQRLLYAALLTQERKERDFTAILTEQVALLGAMGATKAAESNRHGNY